MREHIAQVHEGKKREKKRTRNLKCSSCGYKSETRRGMLKHITLQHNGQNVQIINVAPKKALFEKAKEDHKKSIRQIMEGSIVDPTKVENQILQSIKEESVYMEEMEGNDRTAAGPMGHL